MVGEVQQVIASAIGAETITTTVEGRERYNVSLRYPRDVRSDPQTMGSEVLVPLPNGASIPLGQVATVKLVQGPASIRTENAQLAAYIFVDARERDLASYVEDARRAVAEKVSFPQGYYAVWSGQFEYYERAKQRLMIVIPLTLVIILLLLYLNFRRMTETLIVMLSLPFSLVGGLWLMWWLGFHLSVAVAVGFIALAGVAAETGVVMLIYLDHALAQRRALAAAERRPFSRDDLYAAIMEGAVERVRPKMMTVVAIMAGLLPIMWSTRHRLGGHAAHRRADDRRDGFINGTYSGRDSGCLRPDQGHGPAPAWVTLPPIRSVPQPGSTSRGYPRSIQPPASCFRHAAARAVPTGRSRHTDTGSTIVAPANWNSSGGSRCCNIISMGLGKCCGRVSRHHPLSTGSPAACHSGCPSSTRRALKPRAFNIATASNHRTQ